MPNLEELTQKILDFREARDWKKFHNPKDLALSLTLEAAEVLEHFQWKNKEEIEDYVKTHKDEIGEELADVLYWVLLMSHDINLNILDALDKKIEKNKQRYPVDKVKGRHVKPNKL